MGIFDGSAVNKKNLLETVGLENAANK